MFAETGAFICFTWNNLESILILEDRHPSWYFSTKISPISAIFQNIFWPPVKGIVDPKMNILSSLIYL